MKALTLPLVTGSLLWTAVSSVGGTSSVAGAPDDAEPRVCVYVAPLGVTVLALDVVTAELARVWRINGVDVGFPTAIDPQGCGGPSARRVVLILVDGDQARLVAKAMHISAGATAATVLSAPTELARVYVFVDRARRLLDGRMRAPRGCERLALSLLAARFAAHEIGHVLLGSSSHTRAGLMRATYDTRDAWAQPDAAYLLSAGDQAEARCTLYGTAGGGVALRVEQVRPR